MGDPLFGSDLITVMAPDGRIYTMPRALAERFPSLRPASPRESGEVSLPVGRPTGRGATELPIGTPEPQPTGRGQIPLEVGAPRDRWLPGARPTPSQAIDRATHPYETRLTPDGERRFQQWVADNNIPFDPGPNADYDMRGFWLANQNGDPGATAAVNGEDGQVHFPDAWKTPHHRTFSDESTYAQPGAPTWVGGVLLDRQGRTVADERQPIAPPVVGPRTPRRKVDAELDAYRRRVRDRQEEDDAFAADQREHAIAQQLDAAGQLYSRSAARRPLVVEPTPPQRVEFQPAWRQPASVPGGARPAAAYPLYVDGGTFGSDSGGE